MVEIQKWLLPQNIQKEVSMSKKAQRYRKWQKRKIRHHILNRCRNGSNCQSNLITWTYEKEQAWHFLFHHLTFREAAAVLLRVAQMKGGRYEQVRVQSSDSNHGRRDREVSGSVSVLNWYVEIPNRVSAPSDLLNLEYKFSGEICIDSIESCLVSPAFPSA